MLSLLPVSLAVESATFPSEPCFPGKHKTTPGVLPGAPPHPRVSRREGTLPPNPRTLAHQNSGLPGLPPSQAPMQRPQLWGHSRVPTSCCGTLWESYPPLLSSGVLSVKKKKKSGETNSGLKTVLPRSRWAKSRDTETRTFFRPWPVRVSRSGWSSPHPAQGQGGTRWTQSHRGRGRLARGPPAAPGTACHPRSGPAWMPTLASLLTASPDKKGPPVKFPFQISNDCVCSIFPNIAWDMLQI